MMFFSTCFRLGLQLYLLGPGPTSTCTTVMGFDRGQLSEMEEGIVFDSKDRMHPQNFNQHDLIVFLNFQVADEAAVEGVEVLAEVVGVEGRLAVAVADVERHAVGGDAVDEAHRVVVVGGVVEDGEDGVV